MRRIIGILQVTARGPSPAYGSHRSTRHGGGSTKASRPPCGEDTGGRVAGTCRRREARVEPAPCGSRGNARHDVARWSRSGPLYFEVVPILAVCSFALVPT